MLPLLFFLLLPARSTATNCSCYETSTNDYFTSYNFHDFRNITVNAIPPFTTTIPANPDYSSGQAPENVGVLQPGFISSPDFNNSWGIQDWGKTSDPDAPVTMWNSFSNIFIDKNNDTANTTSMLVLRTKRFEDFQTAAEMENLQKNLFYASIRVRARITGASGAVAGMFIFRSDDQESDIEILTRDGPDKIRYSNQPDTDSSGNDISGASTQVNINNDVQVDSGALGDKRRRVSDGVVWTDWHTHRIDWIKGKSSWFVDGKKVLDKTYGVPTKSTYLILNMWSDGGVWAGNMTVGDEARLEVEWVEMVYNTSGPILDSKRSTKSCDKVCNVDANKDTIVNGFQSPADTSGGSGGIREYTMSLLLGGCVLVAVMGMV